MTHQPSDGLLVICGNKSYSKSSVERVESKEVKRKMDNIKARKVGVLI